MLRLFAGTITCLLVLQIASARADDAEPPPRAEAGHVSVALGALIADEAGGTRARPTLRAELAFNVVGPIAAGGFVQVAFADLPLDRPAFGGGLIATLRPELSFFGLPEGTLVPHLEITGARLQLPSGLQGTIDAWSVEARAHHGWYFALPEGTTLADAAWTFALAVTIDLR
jgi:hypothetical protein